MGAISEEKKINKELDDFRTENEVKKETYDKQFDEGKDLKISDLRQLSLPSLLYFARTLSPELQIKIFGDNCLIAKELFCAKLF